MKVYLCHFIAFAGISPVALTAASGDLDTNFNTTGKVTTSVGIGNAGAQSVALQSDGKIVSAGSF